MKKRLLLIEIEIDSFQKLDFWEEYRIYCKKHNYFKLYAISNYEKFMQSFLK